MFVAVLKQIELKCKIDPAFAESAFPNTLFDRSAMMQRASWNAAIERMDDAAPDQVRLSSGLLVGQALQRSDLDRLVRCRFGILFLIT